MVVQVVAYYGQLRLLVLVLFYLGIYVAYKGYAQQHKKGCEENGGLISFHGCKGNSNPKPLKGLSHVIS
jgi:hypothetical protein